MYVDYREIKCPKCGENHFREGCTFSTCMASRPVYKDGVRISKDPNWYFTTCECLECGETFTIIIIKEGEPTKVKLGRRNYCDMDKD